MVAGKYDFVIEEGASFSRVLTFDSDYTMPVSAQLVAATATGATPVINLSSTDSSDYLSIASNTVTILMTPTYTAALNFTELEYNLEFTFNGGVKTRILEGIITLSREI